jgi:DnaJ-like protein
VAERKPPGVSWESWIDRQIREGMERGEFDDLPGHGKPLRDLDRARDEMWWVKDKLRRESVSYLPPTLAVRKDLDDARARIAVTESEAVVRDIVAEINARIVAVNSRVTDGPPSTLVPLDVEQVVEDWKATRRPSDG